MFCRATVNSMNITEVDWAFQSMWSDCNAAFVGTSDETQGTVKKLFDLFLTTFALKAFNTKQTLNDKGKELAKTARSEKNMEVGEIQEVLVTAQKTKADQCKVLAKRKPNQAAMRTPLNVSSD